MVKNLPTVQETQDRSWVRKILGGGHGNPLQYCCLRNPRDRGAWWATVHGVREESDKSYRLTLSLHCLRELRSCMPHGVAKKILKKEKVRSLWSSCYFLHSFIILSWPTLSPILREQDLGWKQYMFIVQKQQAKHIKITCSSTTWRELLLTCGMSFQPAFLWIERCTCFLIKFPFVLPRVTLFCSLHSALSIWRAHF